jgi:hypothetical protein
MKRHCGFARVMTLVVLGATVFLKGAVGQAQSPSIASYQRASRTQLQERLTTVERQVTTARSGDRSLLVAEASNIRMRLERGDFKPGDRFVVTLRQDSVRSDTLVVRDSLIVAVLNLPEFSVAGVLRSELEDRLGAHVSRFLRNAVVRTTLLTRVSVTGAVRSPGFYYALPDRPINDLLTSAGGPLPEADLNKLRVQRVGRNILIGKDAKKAVEEGRTLEALDVQSGDTVHIPVKRKINWQLVIQVFFIVTSLLFALIQFLQWYYGRED